MFRNNSLNLWVNFFLRLISMKLKEHNSQNIMLAIFVILL